VTRPRVLLVALCAGYFLVLLDVTIVNVALPSLADDLGAGTAGLQWVVDAYAVTLASLLLVAGTLGDVLGHRRVVLVGLAAFGVASVACGIAPSTGVLVGARAVQGVGAALLLPGTLALIGDAHPGRAEQARAIGIWAAVGGAALPAGPLLGGALVEWVSWRAVFLVNLPVVLAVALVIARGVPRTPRTDRPVDGAGSALAALTLGAVVYAVIGDSPAATVSGAVVAVAAAAAFVAVERRVAAPMLPLGLFSRPSFALANGAAAVMNLATLGMLFVVTLWLQGDQGRSPFAAGLALLPLFLPLSAVAPVAGRVIARTGPRPPMAAGLLVGAAGFALLGTDHLTTALLLWGSGIGVLTPAVVAGALASVEPARAGLASGVNNTARQAGGAVGVAVYGAITDVRQLGVTSAVLFTLTAVAAMSSGWDAGQHGQ
jgi:DHA2 family methylenomycin A resistance protein-like MFS transporter